MKNIKINFDISENDITTITIFPENISDHEKLILSDKFSLFLHNLQSGNLMSNILHSIVEYGIITDNKNFSDLIIKKVIQTLSITTEEKPIITPSEAFVFKEKQ